MGRKKRFDRGVPKQLDDLPDHILHAINELCEKLLVKSLVENGESIDLNIVLGAFQRALAFLVAKCFPIEQIEETCSGISSALLKNAKLWAEDCRLHGEHFY